MMTQEQNSMRIEDLSIGDWVMYRDREWQVCSLYKFTEEVGLWRKDSQFCEYVSDLHPIPLTPEILEKNGWKEIVRNIKYQTWAKGDIYILKYSAEERYCLFMRRYEMKFSLYHTHQLQHALRLAGVGNEIEV